MSVDIYSLVGYMLIAAGGFLLGYSDIKLYHKIAIGLCLIVGANLV